MAFRPRAEGEDMASYLTAKQSAEIAESGSSTVVANASGLNPIEEQNRLVGNNQIFNAASNQQQADITPVSSGYVGSDSSKWAINAPKVADLNQPANQGYIYGSQFLGSKANDAAVNTLYRAYFGRDASAAELKNWGASGGADTTVKALEDFLKKEQVKYKVPEGTNLTPESFKKENNINLPSGTTSGTGGTGTADTNGALSAADQAIADIKARQDIINKTQTEEQKKDTGLAAEIAKLTGDLSGQAAYEIEQTKAKVDPLNEQLTSINNEITAKIAEKERARVDQEGKPVTMQTIYGAEAQRNAVYNSEILTLTARANALMNNITLAEKQVQQAVDAKYKPIEEAIAIAKAQRDAIKDILTDQEKIQADALDEIDAEKKQALEDKKTEETNIKNVMFKAMDKGITDKNILDKIVNSKSLTEAMGILGDNMPKATVEPTAEYKNWALAGGEAGTGMSFAEWQGKSPVGDVSPYQAERSYRTIQSIDELIPQISGNTTGWGAFFLGKLPQSEARTFNAQLDTLKSNIAFGELTAMREASKTGGALGQVSDREGQLLQSALGALDQLQSADQLKGQLEKIKASIQRWNNAIGASTNSNMSDFAW